MKNYRNIALILLAIGILCACLTACGTQKNEVHMTSTNFVKSSITINKGESILLVDDDQSAIHIIDNGRWLDSTQLPGNESGAPIAQDIQVSSNVNGEIGPFNKAGTFHYYCTIHPGMNLSVIVK
jgi:plastocyanin